MRRKGAKDSSQRQSGEACSKSSVVFCNDILYGRDRKHVVEWFDWHGTECAADMTDGIILHNL